MIRGVGLFIFYLFLGHVNLTPWCVAEEIRLSHPDLECARSLDAVDALGLRHFEYLKQSMTPEKLFVTSGIREPSSAEIEDYLVKKFHSRELASLAEIRTFSEPPKEYLFHQQAIYFFHTLPGMPQRTGIAVYDGKKAQFLDLTSWLNAPNSDPNQPRDVKIRLAYAQPVFLKIVQQPNSTYPEIYLIPKKELPAFQDELKSYVHFTPESLSQTVLSPADSASIRTAFMEALGASISSLYEICDMESSFHRQEIASLQKDRGTLFKNLGIQTAESKTGPRVRSPASLTKELTGFYESEQNYFRNRDQYKNPECKANHGGASKYLTALKSCQKVEDLSPSIFARQMMKFNLNSSNPN